MRSPPCGCFGWVVSATFSRGYINRSFQFNPTQGSTGVEFTPGVGHVLTLGLGWAKPSEDTYGPGLSDEYVTELSYRFQLTKNISLLPDIQVVFNQALNPTEDRIWVLGLTARMAL